MHVQFGLGQAGDEGVEIDTSRAQTERKPGRAATIGMGLALLAAMPATAQPRPVEPVERFISTTLAPFSGQDEFDRHLRALRADERDNRRWADSGAVQLAALQAPASAQRSDVPEPDIVIADMRLPPRNRSIGVDPVRVVEAGATMARIRRYLLALRDGCSSST
jgi:hypothetical protein